MYGPETVNVAPAVFYRTPEHIKADIRKISARIAEVNEMLNVREMLADFLGEDSEGEVEKRAEELSELLVFATETLEEFRELNRTLDELKLELTRAMYGMI